MDSTDKYAKLLGVSPEAGLAEIKQKYGEWRTRFEEQVRSGKPEVAQKGVSNLALLDQAYQALAADAAARRREADAGPASAAQAELPMSVEIGSCRVGFNLNNLDGFRFVNNRDVRRFKVSWPGGKITFFNNKLKIGALVFSAELEYRCIEEIRRHLFMPMVFQIKHRDVSVLPMVIVSGPGLGGKIRRLNEEHQLGLNLTY